MGKSLAFHVVVSGKNNDNFVACFIRDDCPPGWPISLSVPISDEQGFALSRAGWDAILCQAACTVESSIPKTVLGAGVKDFGAIRGKGAVDEPSIYFTAHGGAKGWPIVVDAFISEIERLSGARMVSRIPCNNYAINIQDACAASRKSAISFIEAAIFDAESPQAPSPARRKL